MRHCCSCEMGISFKYLNWNVKGFSLDKICLLKDASIIIQQKLLYSILKLNADKWTVLEILTESEETGVHFLEIRGTIYKFSQIGIFRLACPAHARDESVELINLASGSSATESQSWMKLAPALEHIVDLTATEAGFSVIVNIENILYLNNYTVEDTIYLKSTVRLTVCPKFASTLISRIDFRKLSPEFLKHFFEATSLVLTDLVAISRPDGFILLYPIIHDSKFSKPVPIFWDCEVVSSIQVTPCGKAMILFYKSGKIIFIVLNNSKISYKVHNLSSSVTTAAVLGSGAAFYVIWSDSLRTYYFGPVCLNNLIIEEFEIELKGIITLHVIDRLVLAGNVNCNFYQISFDDKADVLANSPKSSLKSVAKIGTKIENLRTELLSVNRKYESILSELVDVSQIIVNVLEDEISLENLSSQHFYKNVWSVEMESDENEVRLVKKFTLNCDFSTNSVITFPINYFLSRYCKSLTVRLVGNVEMSQGLLYLNIASIPLSSRHMECNFFEKIEDI